MISAMDYVGRGLKGRHLRAAIETIEKDARQRPSVPKFVLDLAREIAEKHGVPVELIFGQTLARRPAKARQELMRVLHEEREYPPTKVARWFKRDHSTVLHASGRTSKAKERAAQRAGQ